MKCVSGSAWRLRAAALLSLSLSLPALAQVADRGAERRARSAAAVPTPVDLFGTYAPLSTKLTGTNAVFYNAAEMKYVFTYEEGGSVLRRYEIDVSDPLVQNGVITIYEEVSDTYPVVEGGLAYRRPQAVGGSLNPFGLTFQAVLGSTRSFTHMLLPNNIVVMRYDETIDGVLLVKRYIYEPRGKTLVIRIDNDGAPQSNHYRNYRGFTFNKNANLVNPKDILVTYAETAPLIVTGPPNDRAFITTYIEWTRSGHNSGAAIQELFSGTTHFRGHRTVYIGDGSVWTPPVPDFMPPIEETVYVTVSSSPHEALPALHRPPSQYRSDLDKRVWFEMWKLHASVPPDPLLGLVPGFDPIDLPFARAGVVLDYLADLGMEDLIVHLVLWQQLYSSNPACASLRPHLYPPNPDWGGSAELVKVRDQETQRGNLFAVYQSYTSMFDTPGNPPGPQWDVSKLTVGQDGNFLNVEPSTCAPSIYGPQPLEVSADEWLGYAQLESPLLEQELDPTASYLDVHPKALWYSKIDFDAGSTTRSFADLHQRIVELIQYQKATFQGPVLGEGGSSNRVPEDTVHAGLVDTYYGELPNDSASPIVPDVELREIKPVATRAGMGFWNRWVGNAGGSVDMSTFDFDEWYATSVALGHGGFLTDHLLAVDPKWTSGTMSEKQQLFLDHLRQFVRTYYLFKDFQQQYLSADVVEILYYDTVTQAFYDLAGAIDVFSKSYFDDPLLKITYDNGLEVHVNRMQTGPAWAVNAADGNTYYLPPNGWVGVNPAQGFVTFSGLADNQAQPSASGNRIDYVESENYVFVDPRGNSIDIVNAFGGCLSFPTTLIRAMKTDGLIVLEQADGTFTTGTLAPCFQGISAAAARPGDQVTVSGVFLPTTLQVFLDGEALPVTSQSNTAVRFRVPAAWRRLGPRQLEVRDDQGAVVQSYTLLVRPLFPAPQETQSVPERVLRVDVPR